MFFFPIGSRSIIEVLSQSVKNEIAHKITEVVYKELKTGNYLQDAYITDITKEIADAILVDKFEFMIYEDRPGFYLRIKA